MKMIQKSFKILCPAFFVLTFGCGGGVANQLTSTTPPEKGYSVDLTWDAPVSSPDPVAGYNVYRCIDGTSSYALLNGTVDVPTAYTDTTVVNGIAYDYIVESVDASGVESAPSNVAVVTIPLQNGQITHSKSPNARVSVRLTAK